MNYNNEVKNSDGQVIGFRCHICDEAKTKMWGTVCNECAKKNERQTVEWQKGYDFAKKEFGEITPQNRNIQEEAIRNLFRDYLKSVIKEEIWTHHELGKEFKEEYEIGVILEGEINKLCKKAHNDVLEYIIEKYL